MKEWRGTARFHDLGPGAWTLETEDGKTLPMFGAVPPELAGKKVVVRGRSQQTFGFGPAGDGGGIEVTSVEAV